MMRVRPRDKHVADPRALAASGHGYRRLQPAASLMYNRMNGRNTNAKDSLFAGAASRNQPGVQGDSGEQARRLLEEQNDEQISHLSLQISQLKSLTQGIHTEVLEQNKYLDSMGKEMDNTEGLLGGTMKRLGIMMDQGGSKHMLYLVGFVVFVFVLLYYTIRAH